MADFGSATLATDMANVLERYLKETAVYRGAVDRNGARRIILAKWMFDRLRIDDIQQMGKEISLIVSDWMSSDLGTWVLENIANLKVDGYMDAIDDETVFVVSARVDQMLAVEHEMRWS